MASFNKVILMGNLTRDPEYAVTTSQTPVVKFGMAMNRKWKGQDGQMHDDVCYVNCTLFGRRADVVNKYFHRGDPIFVEGRLSFSSWTAQDGTKRSTLEVMVENFEFMGGGNRGGSGQGQPYDQNQGGGYSNQGQGGGYSAPQQQSAPAPQAPPQDPQQPPAYGELNDDIPF